MRNSRNELLGVMQLLNPRDRDTRAAAQFSADDERLAVHFAGMAAGAIERSSMTRALVLRMMRLAELRDPKETGAHVRRVSEVASHLFVAWARQRGMPENEVLEQLDKLRPAAMLHDVGKVGISDAILKKPGKLDDAEYAQMKLHTTIGAETLLGVHTSLDDAVREVTLYHHARWDGTGYPTHAEIRATIAKLGLDTASVPEPAGLGIPLPARLVAIADVFDALMSRRAYKDPWDPSKVREEIARCSGTHFDPELVELFVSNFDAYRSLHAGITE
jgi:HD-GYP domain-containing protein (c-di-GMP phosphodiesterase class II)